MDLCKAKIMLITLLIIECTQSYFMDFEAWSGSVNISLGTIIKGDTGKQTSYDFVANQTKPQPKTSASTPTPTLTLKRNLQQQGMNRFEYYFGKQDTKNYAYNVSSISTGSMFDPVYQKQANKSPEMQGVRSMYLALGIPNYAIEQGYVPFLKMRLHYIDYLFSGNADPKQEQFLLSNLYWSLQEVKQYTDYIVDTYLKDVKIIIYGSNNKAIGHKLFISTDNMIVNANNTFIYNGGSTINKVKGNNIIRTKRYEFRFDQLEAVKNGQITKCIKIVR